ncbi:YD repeat-containing protein [Chitinimonas taiwanensis DSM 18899]|uniref:YD repeat-containing protein n=2 Tax=Chitinimonas TaxID=240411 RepID=A0A1K2HJF6_9NEIS|nr:YD repeat-containing protein [Chitinimonas taiwanensis DSM 18899]
MSLLDPPPWAGWLCLAYALGLITLWCLLCKVWKQVLGFGALLALPLGVLPSLVVLSISDDLWASFNSQQIQNSVLQPSLVRAVYTTTTSVKGRPSTHEWIALSHPLRPSQAMRLRRHLVPEALHSQGLVVCSTLRTGRFGWRWLESTRACRAGELPRPLPSFGLVMLPAVLEEHVAAQNLTQNIAGYFDERGQAWWLDQTGIQPKLLSAQRKASVTNERRCQLLGEARLSSDKLSLLSFLNISAPGSDQPPLPHWKALGRNVLVFTPGADGTCRLIADLHQPGWTLDADFDQASRRLAVFSADRRPQASSRQLNLGYQVSIYTFDAEGNGQLVEAHPVSQDRFQRLPVQQARLGWDAGRLVLQHPASPQALKVFQNAQSTDSVAGTQLVPAPPPLPKELSYLTPNAWKLAAKAPQASLHLYVHPDYSGALLFQQASGIWYHIAPVRLKPHDADTEGPEFFTFNAKFNTSDAHLSPDGQRLIGCNKIDSFAPRKHCVLLSLSWPD